MFRDCVEQMMGIGELRRRSCAQQCIQRNAGFLQNERSVHSMKPAKTLIWYLVNKLRTKYKLMATGRFKPYRFQNPHDA